MLLSVFSPLQTVLVNPSNVSPSNSSNSSSSYFTDQAVLDNVPTSLLYMAAIYAVVFIFCLLVTKEAPKEMENTAEASKQSLTERLASAWSYVYREAARTGDFYLLWLARFLYLTVGAGVLAHWKTFAFTQSSNDQVKCILDTEVNSPLLSLFADCSHCWKCQVSFDVAENISFKLKIFAAAW